MRYLVLTLAMLICAAVTKADEPNVIIIQAADLGINDISYHIQGVPQTRAIDSIMANGVLFTRAYTPCPENVPSRFGMLTGMYPQRHGIEANPKNENDPKVLKYWPKDAKSIGHYAHKAEYKSAYFGDWEFGYDPGENPWEVGFDYYCGALKRLYSYYPNPKSNDFKERIFEMPQNIEISSTSKTYTPNVLTDKAIEYIETNKDDKFFIYMSFTNPAYSRWVKAPQEYYEGLDGMTEQRKDHLAHVMAFDKCLGRILVALKEKGLTENTIVVVTSTNGPPLDNFSRSPNRPELRGGKSTLYDGALRVPMLIQWPEKWPKQMAYEYNVSTLDVISTVMKAMGAKTNIWDGEDLTKMVLAPNINPRRTLHFRFMGQLATIYGKYKIMHSLINTGTMVYDLEEDPREQINIAARYPGIVKMSMELCRKWNLENQPIEMFEESEKVAIDQQYIQFNSRR